MRLPNSAHASQPWRIHEVTRDFRLEDVWPLPGGDDPDDFRRLVAIIASIDPSRGPSRASRALFAIRWKLGRLLGWDSTGSGLGSGSPTLRDRLPEDLRAGPRGPTDVRPFTSLFQTDDEWAAELANRTMHGVIHIGRVPQEAGGFRAQMAILVKPHGMLGTGYMAAIKPFRYAVVYPALLRQIERAWRADASATARG